MFATAAQRSIYSKQESCHSYQCGLKTALTLNSWPLLPDFCQQWRFHEHQTLKVNMRILAVKSLCCQPKPVTLQGPWQPEETPIVCCFYNYII